MERIKKHLGKTFAIKGTPKELLKVEKELVKLGCTSREKWNSTYRGYHTDHLIVYPDKEYAYHTHPGGSTKIVIKDLEGVFPLKDFCKTIIKELHIMRFIEWLNSKLNCVKK